MQIFIMRHGDAQQSGCPDAQRELTPLGISEVSAMASWIKSRNIDHVLVSPFKRAQQTSSVLIPLLQKSPTVSTVDLITPSGSPLQVHHYIDGLVDDEPMKSLLIVSHMPLVSFLVAELTYEKSTPIFQTAAIAEIEYDLTKMKGKLIGVTSPSHV